MTFFSITVLKKFKVSEIIVELHSDKLLIEKKSSDYLAHLLFFCQNDFALDVTRSGQKKLFVYYFVDGRVKYVLASIRMVQPGIWQCKYFNIICIEYKYS